MTPKDIKLTYIDGPTVLIEVAGLRLLTDPTFDTAQTDYLLPGYSLHKTSSPGLNPADLGTLDIVLLSHDHHRDNLDTRGKEITGTAKTTLTTRDGAQRLRGNARGLSPWEQVDFQTPGGGTLRITATPARHGPEGGDRGPVVGFVLQHSDEPGDAMYISGDTVWFQGVAEVARRFPVSVAMLFMGAARVAPAGPDPLTFTADEGVLAARAFAPATIIPVHFEGWAHFSESRREIEAAFAAANLENRLLWLPPGKPETLTFGR